jgi:hypothetical protein
LFVPAVNVIPFGSLANGVLAVTLGLVPVPVSFIALLPVQVSVVPETPALVHS